MLNYQDTTKLTTLGTFQLNNALKIHKVLTKHVNILQGVYPLDLLQPTLIAIDNCH